MRRLILSVLILAACSGRGEPSLSITAMTFNVGTTTGLAHDGDDNGYTNEHAAIADELYENSLSWNPAEAALADFLAERRPTVVVFQELYFDPWCETIPVDPSLDFVCRDYTAQRPLQIRRLLGDDYQIACAQGQEDNCAGVLKSFATMRGCDPNEVCLGGLEGMGPPDGCSKGARVGRVVLDLAEGGEMTLVNVHASSGAEEKDRACRASQLAQVFVDRGDGQPAANGEINLIMGDINTDPFLFADDDVSAQLWNQHVGDGKPFRYISETEPGGPGTYAGLFRIDVIVSDVLRRGDKGCEVPPVLDSIYWDHRPVICHVER